MRTEKEEQKETKKDSGQEQTKVFCLLISCSDHVNSDGLSS